MKEPNKPKLVLTLYEYNKKIGYDAFELSDELKEWAEYNLAFNKWKDKKFSGNDTKKKIKKVLKSLVKKYIK